MYSILFYGKYVHIKFPQIFLIIYFFYLYFLQYLKGDCNSLINASFNGFTHIVSELLSTTNIDVNRQDNVSLYHLIFL